MEMHKILVPALGALLTACFLSPVGAQGNKEIAVVDSSTADFKDVIRGVKKKLLWGNPDKGPYGTFTLFEPGLTNPLHSHSSEIRIVVLRGAYIYRNQAGTEKRVEAGSYISIPAGDVHFSGGDAREGALFYEESQGKFDLKPARPRSKN